MKSWKNKLKGRAGELLLASGALLAAVGAGMIYLPAGLIARGRAGHHRRGAGYSGRRDDA